MHRVLLTVAILLLSFQYSAGQETAEPTAEPTTRIEDCRSGLTVDINQLIDQISDSDVIVLGEQHDNDAGHEFQLNVIRGLREKGHQVVISTEQFERDVQGAVDDYLAGRIDEETFLKASRPWKNYPEHYRPIVEFAKSEKLPVLAANIPRRIAADVAAGRPVAMLDQALAPRQTSTPKDLYWSNFEATMKGHMGADGSDQLEKFYASQCLKDDAMAEAITDYLTRNAYQQKTVVHLCGHFHSDYGLGTVARIVQRKPLARVSVVTMETASSDVKKETLEALKSRAHFVFWTVPNASDSSASDAPASK